MILVKIRNMCLCVCVCVFLKKRLWKSNLRVLFEIIIIFITLLPFLY